MSVGLPKILYDNRFNDGTPVASTTATGFNVLNVRDMRPYSFWKPSTFASSQTITVDCGSAKAADYAAIYAHDMFSRGVTVQVRGSTDNFSASDVLVASSTPTSDAPVVVTFNSVSYRYWRLRFSGSTAPTIGIALIGAALTLPRRHTLGFDPLSRAVKAQTNRSVAGYPLGRVISYEEWRQQISIDVVSWTFLRNTWVPAWKAWLRDEPFLYAWDTVTRPQETVLAQMDGDFSAPTIGGELCRLEFALSGVAN
jgi:hypothetical protein